MGRDTVSACIIAFNEEINIRRCLESVKWCDEIIIIDSYSTDTTVEICREYTDKIHTREYKGNIDQKNFAASLTTCKWVLSLDADESVRPDLKQEIFDILENNDPLINGYYFKRRAYLFGKWIKHCGWYPDYKLRLFRRGKGNFGGREPHDQLIVHGQTKRLKGAIDHFTYRSVREYIYKIVRYSDVASTRIEYSNPCLIFLLMLVKPPVKFFEMYFLKCGFLDGVLGLIISFLTAFGNFLKFAYLLDRRINFTNDTGDKDTS
jgi:glycosyltransferase involved in cell wall biosynthesis